MPPIVTTAEIDRPAARVFACATDPSLFTQWQKGVEDGHLESLAGGTGVPAVGTKCITTRRIGGASRPVASVLTHVDPPLTWGVRGTDGPIRATVDVVVEPVTDSRSRLTISVNFTGHGIGKVLVPLIVRREARKEMPENIAALKRLSRRGSGLIACGGGGSGWQRSRHDRCPAAADSGKTRRGQVMSDPYSAVMTSYEAGT